jgi:hypothetical protein
MGQIGLCPADPVEPHMPGKGLFRLGVALLQGVGDQQQGSPENTLPRQAPVGLMEAQSASHEDISWALEDWASKKISMARGYLTTFHTQPITQQSTTHPKLTLSNVSSFCLYITDR